MGGRTCEPGCTCGRHVAVKIPRHAKVCVECGTPFLAVRSDGRFCSRKCSLRNYAASHPQMRASKARRWREGHPGQVEAQRTTKRDAARQARREQTQSYLELQDGCCYLCGDELGQVNGHEVHMDHDHRCCPKGRRTRGMIGCERCRRGLTCHACNLLIGYGQDDPARLRRIAENLEAAQAAVTARLT